MTLHYPRAIRRHCPNPADPQAPSLSTPVRTAPPARTPETARTPEPAPRGLVIDHERRHAAAGDRELRLTFMEFELLSHLVSRPLQVHTRRQLLASVWGPTSVGGGRTVDVHIARLRSKLGPEYRNVITTVRQVGYAYDPARAAA